MIKKPNFQGLKNRDVIPPAQLREQARLVALGRLQGRAKWWQVVLVLFAAIAVVALAATLIVKVMWATPGLNSAKYQAVFLEDGKVFFGKLKNTDGEYITLENAYYTRTTQSSNGQTNADQTALVKVGSETYGPEENIQIARSKVLFWQNLRDNSQVTTAINSKINQ